MTNHAPAELRAAIRTVLRAFDEGVFVRSIDGDSNLAWAIKLFPYLHALAILKQASEEPEAAELRSRQQEEENSRLREGAMDDPPSP